MLFATHTFPIKTESEDHRICIHLQPTAKSYPFSPVMNPGPLSSTSTPSLRKVRTYSKPHKPPGARPLLWRQSAIWTGTMTPSMPRWRGIVGYSLAGLFALYSLYQTDLFSCAASVSGSLWFPGIKEYLVSHKPKRRPDCLYFSLGEKESKTRNPILKNVRQNTEAISAFYQSQGIHTVFHLNPGNHYDHAAERTAAGICWLLNQ